MPSNTLSLEYEAILNWIRQGSSVLDLGCGDGALLDLLVREKGVRAQGIEINEQAIYQCVAKGLSVFHEDIDHGLSDYADQSFDYVILNQTFQQVKNPDLVLKEALRVGRQVIVGFPNFAHYLARLRMFFGGKAPVTPSLPYAWHDTPNLHFLSILDFIEYCSGKEIKIRDSVFIAQERNIKLFPNLFALKGIFLVSDGGTNDTNWPRDLIKEEDKNLKPVQGREKNGNQGNLDSHFSNISLAKTFRLLSLHMALGAHRWAGRFVGLL